MTNWGITTLVAILIILSKPLIAQNDERKYNIQFDYGISKTLHYKQPINFRMCFEGCVAEEQIARMAPNFDLSLYRDFDRKNSAKIGIGFSEYRFREKGMELFLLSPYETIQEFKYFTFSTGYRHIFLTSQRISPFFETELLCEIRRAESDFLKKYGVAIKPQIGAVVRISDKLTIVFAGLYKSGIVKYNEIIYNKDYIPSGYGVELGMNMKI